MYAGLLLWCYACGASLLAAPIRFASINSLFVSRVIDGISSQHITMIYYIL
nr:MAG TPA: hypothetical protein [Caudoviricetes sp.]